MQHTPAYKIGIFALFFILLFSIVSAAPSPYPFYGVVTLDGARAHAMSLTLENTVTGESVHQQTINGDFVGDMSEFRSGWSASHLFKITYCVQDTRCSEVSDTFYPTGDMIQLSKDLPLQPKGLSGPFIIYGTVIIDGTIIEDDIVLENIDKGYTENLETNDRGEYTYNHANWGRYDTGDRIKLTYSSFSVSGTIVSNLPGLHLNLHASSPTDPNQGGGGGSSDPEEPIPPTDPPVDPVDPEQPKDPEDPVIPTDPVDPEDPEDPIIPDPEPKGLPVGKILISVLILVIIGVIIYYKYYRTDA